MLKRLLAASGLAVLLVATGASGAQAAAVVECPQGTVWNGDECSLVIKTPSSGGGSGGGGSAAKSACTYQGMQIACASPHGYWNAARNCYVQPSSPQPPQDNAIWAGHTDGAIYTCTVFIGGVTSSYWFWAASSPVAVDPAALAQQIRDSMTFTPAQIGIVPEAKPGSIGLVGLPTWLWVQNPGATVLGPQTKSLTAGGVTVTLTAKVTSTTWTMGDGGVATCVGAGTPYQDAYGADPSPTCGYRYAKQGVYTVTARTNWTATWTSNTGAQGVFNFAVANSTSIAMGEAQVINR